MNAKSVCSLLIIVHVTVASACAVPSHCKQSAQPAVSKPAPPPPPRWNPSDDVLGLEPQARQEQFVTPDSEHLGLSAHEALVEDKLAHHCSTELVKAQFYQDVVHQIHADAHFDNCAFEDTFKNIEKLLSEADSYAAKRDRDETVFRIGQILHAIHDFYAHTNYIEIMAAKHPNRFQDVPIVAVWNNSDQDVVRSMIKSEKLISGYVWWGFPKECCPEWNVPSHADMSKDSASSPGGSKPIAGWSMVAHVAALMLSEKSSLEFLKYCFNRWPFLKGACGKSGAILYYRVPDRRADP